MEKKKLFNLAKKTSLNYYSIYPSFLSDNDKNSNCNYKYNIKIKLYNNIKSFDDYSILPVKYCTFRNCYVFDIPKNKYNCKNSKILYFNFITNNNKVIIDPKYKATLLGDNYINQIDIRDYERNCGLKKVYFNCNSQKSKEDELASSSDNESIKDEGINCMTFNISTNKLSNSKLELSNTYSTKDSLSLNSPGFKKSKKKRAKSILRNKRGSISAQRRENRSVNKKVSFGSSEISFYKSQFIKKVLA